MYTKSNNDNDKDTIYDTKACVESPCLSSFFIDQGCSVKTGSSGWQMRKKPQFEQ